MKTKYYMALLAGLFLLVSACGSSSSNDDGNTQLQTDDQPSFCEQFPQAEACEEFNDGALNSYCLNNPQDPVCDQIEDEGNDMGFDDYFGGNDDLYGDGAYNGAGGYCGCDNGQQPVIYQGQRMCERRTQSGYREREIVVGYQRRGDRERVSAEYRYADGDEYATSYEPVGDNCYEAAGVRCNPNGYGNDCQVRDNYGQYVNARCVRVQGTNYGYCQEQTGGYNNGGY